MLKKSLAVVTAAALTLGALAPAGAQPGRFNDRFDRNDRFNDRLEQAYRDGYRNGFNDARDRRRFDDRYVVAGPPPDRDARWRQRYTQTYTYNDDSFYRECRQSVDPAGVIAGAVLVFFVSTTFTRPLKRLVAGVRALQEGDFDFPLVERGSDGFFDEPAQHAVDSLSRNQLAKRQRIRQSQNVRHRELARRDARQIGRAHV